MGILKAVWIAALNPDAKGPMAAKSLRTRDDVKRMAERLVAEGFHYVFPCVNYMEDQTQCQPLTGFDPLREIVAALRGSAVKVHPWLCIAYQPSGTAHPLHQKGGGLQAMYNDHGTARPYSDHALCMARPEVQAFKLEMYRRLGAAYELDGYHLDYIRWIEHGNDSDVTNHVEVFNACVCEHCRTQFRRLTGEDLLQVTRHPRMPAWRQWMRWRCDIITHFVEALHAQRQLSGHRVSAAVFSGYPRWPLLVGQDWKQWIDRGLVDTLCPMAYHRKPSIIHEHTIGAVRMCAGRAELLMGLAKDTGKSDTLSPQELHEVAEAAVTENADGICLFHWDALTDADFQALRGL